MVQQLNTLASSLATDSWLRTIRSIDTGMVLKGKLHHCMHSLQYASKLHNCMNIIQYSVKLSDPYDPCVLLKSLLFTKKIPSNQLPSK